MEHVAFMREFSSYCLLFSRDKVQAPLASSTFRATVSYFADGAKCMNRRMLGNFCLFLASADQVYTAISRDQGLYFYFKGYPELQSAVLNEFRV